MRKEIFCIRSDSSAFDCGCECGIRGARRSDAEQRNFDHGFFELCDAEQCDPGRQRPRGRRRWRRQKRSFFGRPRWNQGRLDQERFGTDRRGSVVRGERPLVVPLCERRLRDELGKAQLQRQNRLVLL